MDVVKVSLFNYTIGLNYFKFIFVFLSVGLIAQTKVDESQLMVFEPNEQSVQFNEIYTQNFFFGNFGVRQLISAVPINNQSVKTIEITAATSESKAKPVMEMHYNQEGQLTQMKVMKAFFGQEMNVEYQYKEGVLEQEKLIQNKEEKVNLFFYAKNQMIIKNSRGMLDVYSLNGKILTKESYMDGDLVLNDRIAGKCRLTYYQKKPINKYCFSNMNLETPLIIEEYTNNEDRAGKLILQVDQVLKITQNSEFEYSIYSNDSKRYTLKLNQDLRLTEFTFLGSKAEKTKPVNYKFNYIYY